MRKFALCSVAALVALWAVKTLPEIARKFPSPSEAFVYVQEPIQTAKPRAAQNQKLMDAAYREQSRRAKQQCGAFEIDKQHGDELFVLAKICRSAGDLDRNLEALQRYLSEPAPPGGYNPEARSILAIYTFKKDPDGAWKIIEDALRLDPLEAQQYYGSQELIESAAEHDLVRASEMSYERWRLLRERLPDVTGEAFWIGKAAADLVHRNYLAGQTDEAFKNLNQAKLALASFPGASGSLRWAEMEMHLAPATPALKIIGSDEIIRPGRVQLLDFFFIHCPPCISSMPELNRLQKRYSRDKFEVIAVTTYKIALQPDSQDPKRVQTAINEIRNSKARAISFAITSDEALQQYGPFYGFPFSALIDKKGRVRLVDQVVDYTRT